MFVLSGVSGGRQAAAGYFCRPLSIKEPASHAQSLEGSQTSPRRLKLREATSGKPLYKVAALSVASRRLLGMTQRNVLPIASILLRDTTARRTAARRDVPGSRLSTRH